MEERESGSFVIGEDGKPRPNLDDEAMSERARLRDAGSTNKKEVGADVKTKASNSGKS
ncbi:MAG: hypothetical protein M1510_10640 [Nitrospirae bacterium]|nr:hypothetical protein [Nitrospirota bacterium]MCL5237408.1 hypothetical protein [Nitrospirota bacterium]